MKLERWTTLVDIDDRKSKSCECKYCEGTGIRDFGFYTRTCECKLQQSES